MKKYTIEDLREGRVILINNGDLDVCREVLREAFPKDGYEGGHLKYYMAVGNGTRLWVSGYSLSEFEVTLPTQSVADFLEKAWSPEEGELVEVSDNGNFHDSYKVMFVA